MAKGKTAVGLDIGSSSVKLVQLKEKKGGYQLLAFGSAPLPPEAIVDGALMNSAAIVQAIQELFARHKVKARDVAIGVRGHSVIIKKISLPRMTQKELNISYDEAEALKVGGQGESDALVPQEVERVIQGVAEQLGGEIQRSLDFYASTAADGKITRALLSGGTARVPALFKTVEARAGMPVEILNPFKNIEIDNKKFDPAVILAAAPSAAVGVGLALRRPGDK